VFTQNPLQCAHFTAHSLATSFDHTLRTDDLVYFNPDSNKKDKLGRVKPSIGLRKIPNETFDKDKLFSVLESFCRNKALIGAGTGGKDEGTSTAQHGLIQGHAYSVLQAKEVTLSGGHFSGKNKIKLVQLRNPW
jgi:hypothetical protein